MSEKIIVIGGSTGSGKSNLALKLAKNIDTEIISADSMQIYKGMDIGTAKVTLDEIANIPHHMIDIVSPKDSFSVSDYVDRAREIITDINNKGKVPIIVGGTGLYIDALIYDFEFNNADIDYEYRHYLEDIAKTKGNIALHDILRELDSEEAEKVHYNNVKRVIRAIEICKSNGGKKSENKKTLHFDTLMFVINTDREILYEKINKRVDMMIEDGLEDEIRALLDDNVTFDMQSMQAIGYKEWKGYLDGISCLDEVKDKIKQNTRNYAKRQITWFFNKYRDIAHFVANDDIDNVMAITKEFLTK